MIFNMKKKKKIQPKNREEESFIYPRASKKAKKRIRKKNRKRAIWQ